MPRTHVMALDQGTSSSRALVFDGEGRRVAIAQCELPQHHPRPGWVEHDPWDLWHTQIGTARQALAQAGLQASDLAAIGLTNQRETTLVWNRRTGEPIHRALVWQDRRTAPICDRWRAQGLAERLRDRTGLVLDAYFSATKLAWLLEEVPGARAAAERGELAFGTVDTWLVWQLTGGALHATDPTNASRTLMHDLHEGGWSEGLLQALDLPAAVLPHILPSAGVWAETRADALGGPVPIAGVAGDQQAALFGQGCLQPGQAKNTYGTGCFLLMHTGDRALASQHGLVGTRAASVDGSARFALEGSVFIGGAVVQWLRDGLRAIQASAEVEPLAATVDDADGVVVVPAFTGLGAPYWRPEARGAIVGLSRGTTIAHIARAALESIAFQSTAVLRAMSNDAVASGGQALQALRVDGGACANDLLMQFQADLLGIPLLRPRQTESTALGAALLAGLGCGLWPGIDALPPAAQAIERTFEPRMGRDEAEARMARWDHAVRQATAA